jgi:hypothetical protein
LVRAGKEQVLSWRGCGLEMVYAGGEFEGGERLFSGGEKILAKQPD